MSQSGEIRSGDPVGARLALLDALEALESHLDSLILVGSQAIYVHTKGMKSKVAEFTRDADLSIDPRILQTSPLIEMLLDNAGFTLKDSQLPGGWWNESDVRVDIMVAEVFAGRAGRSADIRPHSGAVARSTRGIEGCLADNSYFTICSQDEMDGRSFEIKVAGPASLIIAKAFKIHERISNPKRRLEDKDAHDVYRMLATIDLETIMAGFETILKNEAIKPVMIEGLGFINDLFAAGVGAEGSMRAGRAEFGVGEEEQVAQAASILAGELISECRAKDWIS